MQEEPSANAGADARALDQLARSGSDLTQLHRIEFYLRFPTQEAAEHAAGQLSELAFATEAGEAQGGDEWIVRATKNMYPVESDLLGLRDKLNAIAAEGGGRYEGWQAKVFKPGK